MNFMNENDYHQITSNKKYRIMKIQTSIQARSKTLKNVYD